jgi:hypothetical protein
MTSSSRTGYSLGMPSFFDSRCDDLIHSSVSFRSSLYRVHFIPISASYAEIYNIHAYFSGATQSALEAANSTLADIHPDDRRSVEGDKRLRRIARAGKRWKQTIGRTLDMEGGCRCLLFFLFMHGHGLMALLSASQHTCIDCASSGHASGRMIGNRWASYCQVKTMRME